MVWAREIYWNETEATGSQSHLTLRIVMTTISEIVVWYLLTTK